MRDRLIELIRCGYNQAVDKMARMDDGVLFAYSDLADHLLANGVIVPPCKVGQTVWFVHTACNVDGTEYDEILEGKVHSLSTDEKRTWMYMSYLGGLNYWHTFDAVGKTVFLTKEEAEQALKEREQSDR